ncbi:hypothetical protein ES702_00952 [subsurface metagenome]
MHNAKKEYSIENSKSYLIPEWIRILKDYFRESYDNNPSNEITPEKNKKKGIEKIL